MKKSIFSKALLGLVLAIPGFAIADDDLTERQIIRTGIDRTGKVRPESDLAKLSNVKVATSVNYKILLLEPNGKEKLVPEDFEFKIGQQFRLEVEADNDLYLYVFHEGPKGDRTILMPDKYDNGRVPLAKKGEKKVIPDDGTYFEFAPPAGAEKVLVYASPEKKPELTPQGAFEGDAGEGNKKQLELKSAQDKIFSAAKAVSSPAKSVKQVAEAPKEDDDVDIVFRGFDITDDDGTTVMVGSSDASRKPEVFREILLKSR